MLVAVQASLEVSACALLHLWWLFRAWRFAAVIASSLMLLLSWIPRLALPLDRRPALETSQHPAPEVVGLHVAPLLWRVIRAPPPSLWRFISASAPPRLLLWCWVSSL